LRTINPFLYIHENHLLKEFRHILGSDHCWDKPEDLLTYAYDAGHHRAAPELVVFPQNSSQVAAIGRLANRCGVPLIYPTSTRHDAYYYPISPDVFFSSTVSWITKKERTQS
jgi:hypothetical protein